MGYRLYTAIGSELMFPVFCQLVCTSYSDIIVK